MKKAFLILAPILLLVGCRHASFDSVLTVNSEFQIQGKRNKDLTLVPGKSEAKFIIVDKDTLRLKLDGDHNEKVTFDIPKNVHFPTEQGKVFISAADLEQNFDLEAAFQTEHSTSPQTSTSELCTVYVGNRVVCRMEPAYKVCKIVDGKEVCHIVPARQVCYNEPIYVNGHQDVTYHYENSITSLVVNFKAPQSEQVLAELEGMGTEKHDRVIDFQGSCRPDYPYPGHYPYPRY